SPFLGIGGVPRFGICMAGAGNTDQEVLHRVGEFGRTRATARPDPSGDPLHGGELLTFRRCKGSMVLGDPLFPGNGGFCRVVGETYGKPHTHASAIGLFGGDPTTGSLFSTDQGPWSSPSQTASARSSSGAF